MAIEAATEMITESLDMSRDAYSKVDRNSPDLKELLTVQCHNSLFESYTSILSGGNKIDLIKIPKDDVFYAWIEKFRGKNDYTLTKNSTMTHPMLTLINGENTFPSY